MSEENKETVTLHIDGEEVTVPKGTSVLEASLQQKKDVPYFCWHPGLSVPSNCRICLVGIEGVPKLVTSCSTIATDGMKVSTCSDEVKAGRESVMEFLLINHPLDCPVCDQAGECELQNHSFDHGPDHSRFNEDKYCRSTHDLGPQVRFWGTRCILCARCTRFCDEIAGTGELTIVNRGVKVEIDTFPGIELDNPMSMNTVDICPVGALCSKDFLFKKRVWFMNSKSSICGSCSRGCNITVDVGSRDKVERLRPRYNKDINEWWMCDYGRLHYKYINSAKRLQYPLKKAEPLYERVSWSQVYDEIGIKIGEIKEAHGADTIAGMISAWNTSEDGWVFKELFENVLGTKTTALFFAPDGQAWEGKAGFKISADKNPNRKGLENSVQKKNPEKILKDIDSGKIRALFIFDNMPDCVFTDEQIATLRKVDFLIVIGIAASALTEIADIVLPGTMHFEKDGSFTNDDGIVQEFEAVNPPKKSACTEIDICKNIIETCGGSASFVSVQEVRTLMDTKTSASPT